MGSFFGNLALARTESRPPETADFPSRAVVVARETVDPLKHLTAEQRATMNQRHLFCRQVHRLLGTGHTQKEAVAVVASRTDQFQQLTSAGKGGKSALTVHNYRSWMRRIGKKHGRPDWDNKPALADRYSTTVRDRAGSPEFWQIFGAFYLNENRLSVPGAYQLAQVEARRRGIDDCAMPTCDQVAYWFRTHADPAAVHLARYGKEDARNKVIGFTDRDWSAVPPGTVWFGDHHQLDAPCRIWDAERNGWRAVRPWLTAWMDAVSHYFIGWVVRAESPDSFVIEEALLHGIRAAGNHPPSILYIDNGKDYLSAGFTEPVCLDGEHNHSIAGELGIRTINAIVRNARAKTIERRFLNVCQGFAKWWPSYLGSKPADRPQRAQHFYDHPEELPSLQEYCEVFSEWLQDYYHTVASEGKTLRGSTPAAAWDARPEQNSAITDRELYYAFLKPLNQSRTVRRGAIVRVANVDYHSDALWPYFNKEILVKRDRANLEHVFVYTLSGKLIAECTAKQALPAIACNDADRKRIAEAQKMVRRQEKRARTIAHDMIDGRPMVISPIDRRQISGREPLPMPRAGSADAHSSLPPSAEPALFSDADPSLVAELEALRAEPPEAPPTTTADDVDIAILNDIIEHGRRDDDCEENWDW